MSYDEYRALSLFYDGPIPAEARRLAMGTGFAAASKPHKRKAPARTPDWVVKRMSETIRFTAQRRSGRCEKQDLLQAGFTPREINLYQEEAIAKAARDAEAEGLFRGSPDIPVALLVMVQRLERKA